MRNTQIVVTGATGNLGSKVATALIESQQSVIVTGRQKDKLSTFEGKATLLAGNLEDPAFLQALLKDAGAVFLVLPSLTQLSIKAFAEQFINIAEANGISHIVNISNCTLTRFGKPTSLIEFESYLDQAERLHIKHLRCANFFENLNWGIHTPYNPDIALPYISSIEIAETATRYLMERHFTGHSIDELMGAADYSMSDIAAKLGVSYQQVPARVEDKAFFDAFNSGQYELVKRTASNTSAAQDERYTLSYFLEHGFNHELLK